MIPSVMKIIVCILKFKKQITQPNNWNNNRLESNISQEIIVGLNASIILWTFV